ncbi:hypothetical protein BV98_000554 [Sphingobium herbicidovorans NBRC 16415]|uniref:Uncharacterized protein n=1 Tax=Sphingobium herbicidovorans (strain ATCC 700291 / DSM 11019 / CCUG 56400 / KCTC 2939 / LMG 18315 / NBRC 16415 / MH) TaxID=1219045 RepID=A0A086PE78_SPHHM|nr:hypothetical protein [Sphingobium herbicidovorans]KFG91696.1 hypothetical protein BV98_000554 [Sphingobium herbicidovorans NBRC 16415]
MSMDYICSHYGVPARQGGRVRYTGGRHPQLGTIVDAQGAHLLIQIDGMQHAMPYHPTWQIEYLEAEADHAQLLSMWVIIDNPSDHPGKFVAHRWLIGSGVQAATHQCLVGNTLDDVRAQLPAFRVKLARDPSDDRVIVETWI